MKYLASFLRKGMDVLIACNCKLLRGLSNKLQVFLHVGDSSEAPNEYVLRKKRLTIWCDHLYQLYSAKPVIEKYRVKNYQIYLYINKEYVGIAQKYTLLGRNVRSIQSIDSLWLRLLHHFFVQLFVNPEFSVMYVRLRINDSPIIRLLSKQLNMYIDNRNVNECYKRLFRLFVRNRFASEKVISFTRISRPYFFACKGLKHICIMESWDHPVKGPYLTVPDYTLTWNRDLKHDIRNYQNISRIRYIQPLKFRYIKERYSCKNSKVYLEIKKREYKEELNLIKNKDYILYPTTTSSINPEFYEGELLLIEDLVEVTKRAGKLLYIKPKPNGPKGDYDRFKQYCHVIVGIYSDNPNFEDMLDEDYHSFRYLLLKWADLVVNVGTTFVLEAALANRPILQLNMKSPRYRILGEYSKNSHIEQYLLKKNCFEYDGDLRKLQLRINNPQKDFTLYLRSWLTQTGVDD